MLISFISVIISMVTVGFTYVSLRENTKWKKAEFLAAQHEKFAHEPSVILINSLMDRNERYIDVEGSKRNVVMDEVALLLNDDTSSHAGKVVDPFQQLLRDNVDNYLEWLSLFYRYYRNDLFYFDEIRPYVEFQVQALADPAGDDHLKNLQMELWDYISKNRFTEVQELCCLFGYNIRTDNSCHCLREEKNWWQNLKGVTRVCDTLVTVTDTFGVNKDSLVPRYVWQSERGK